MAAKNTYQVKEITTNQEYQVKAESYEYDTTTGRHLFKDGDEVVANLLNVSVRKVS